MLKLSGETSVGLEKIEAIVYNPGIKDSGDLEAATKTITATSEATGLGNADYSKALTLPKPDDARLVIKRIASRYSVTRDSGTSNNTYMRVYVDAQDSDHRLFDVDIQANPLGAVDTHSGALATIFDLLKDGSSHTFYFFFWVDTGDAVISLVRLWEAWGSCSTGRVDIGEIIHTGFMTVMLSSARLDSGTRYVTFKYNNYNTRLFFTSSIKDAETYLVEGTLEIECYGTVATDINYIQNLRLILRSEQ